MRSESLGKSRERVCCFHMLEKRVLKLKDLAAEKARAAPRGFLPQSA